MLSNNFHSKYAVECKIGEGSFSEVVRCKHKHTGVEVAAKILKKTFKSQQHACDLPELIAMRKLRNHQNILHMLESHFDPTSGKVTIIFELMDQSLYDLMKNSKKCVSEAKSKFYLYQIIKGVAHIHEHGIFHRDIKPENILVKGDQLKISDLGSIKGCYASHPYTEYISTRWYRSPECLLTRGYYGPKMDVWAIGCVFYELLTLKPLFPGASEIDQVAKINGILGTPSSRLVAKFRKQFSNYESEIFSLFTFLVEAKKLNIRLGSKSRNISVGFTARKGVGISSLTPFITETGRDILKQMLVYDPSLRINIRRLLEHKYFNDLREWEKLQRLKSCQPISIVPSVSESSKASTVTDTLIRNPALMSVAVGQRRRKKPSEASRMDKVALKTSSVIANEEKRLRQSDRLVVGPPMPKRINHRIPRPINVTGSSSIPISVEEDKIKIKSSLLFNNLAREKLRIRLENRKLCGQGDSTGRTNVKDRKGV